ncbi:MAG: XRE family transcriptional regulator [Pseudomonadota bacterium]
MRSGTPGFQAKRLVEARDSRGLTQISLSDLIGKTSSTISRWESGDQSPELEALKALAEATRLPVAFFLKPFNAHGDAPMFFRSLTSATTVGERKRASVRLRWAQDISLSLQEWVDLPDVDLPSIDVRDHRDIRDEDIERLANECRARWNLGNGPLSDVLLVIENAGIVVVREEVGTSKMDGVSNWSAADARPYMLIARDKATAVRSRMDAAHELAHLVLHRGISSKSLNSAADFKEIERQAFYFAGAFLMPAETFAAEIWSPSLNTLVALKERWKISVAAMIMRCSSLGIVEGEYGQRLWKHYSARGWRKEEPFDDVFEPEQPRLLSRSVKLLIDERVRTRNDLLADFRLSTQDVEALCGLPRGFMSGENAEIVAFPSLKSDQISPPTSDNVVPLKPT